MEDKGYMPSTSVSFSATPSFVKAFGPAEAAAQQQNFEKPSWHKTAPVDVPPPNYQQAKGPPSPSTHDNPLISANENTNRQFEAIMIILCVFGIGCVAGYIGANAFRGT
jgi:hypothetical protein